jgi:hypothetical protein
MAGVVGINKAEFALANRHLRSNSTERIRLYNLILAQMGRNLEALGLFLFKSSSMVITSSYTIEKIKLF